MPEFHKTLTFIAAMAIGTAAIAQDADQAGDSDAEGLSMGNNVDDPTYVKEEYEAWELKCFRSEAQDDPCQMYQLLEGQQGNPVAEFSLFRLPEGNAAAAGATIIVPLATLLTEELKIRIDEGKAKSYPFSFCSQAGCFARIGFTGEEVEALKMGGEAILTIVPAQAPNRQIDIVASLAGFTAAYDNVSIVQNN